MYCKNCGEQLNPNQDVCVKCGVKVGTGTAYCGNCGNQLAAGAVVCTNCGINVKKDDNLNGQDKVILLLVCFFFGGWGIHNFMMGESKRGVFRILMTFCCGIGYIFALIDFIKIICGSYVVDPDALI